MFAICLPSGSLAQVLELLVALCRVSPLRAPLAQLVLQSSLPSGGDPLGLVGRWAAALPGPEGQDDDACLHALDLLGLIYQVRRTIWIENLFFFIYYFTFY